MTLKEGKEQSLLELLDRKIMPVMVRATRTLKDETIIEEGQFVTVLKRENLNLIFGKNWDNKPFRICYDKKKNLIVDTVKEFYPNNEEELAKIEEEITYLQIKKSYTTNLQTFKCGETFIINLYGKTDVGLLITREKDGVEFSLPFDSIFDRNLFVFVKVKERITLKALLRSFQPQTVHFVNSGIDEGLPCGNVKLERVRTYDSIMTVTMRSTSDVLTFETYNLDARIKVVLSNEKLPKQIALLKGPLSTEYTNKMKEIEFLTHYDIYAGRLYGFVDLENHYPEEDKHLVLNRLRSPGDKNNNVFDSFVLIDEGIPKELLNIMQSENGAVTDAEALLKMQEQEFDRIKRNQESNDASNELVTQFMNASKEEQHKLLNEIKEREKETNSVSDSVTRRYSRDNPLYDLFSLPKDNTWLSEMNKLVDDADDRANESVNNSIKSKPLSSFDVKRRKSSNAYAPATVFNPKNVHPVSSPTFQTKAQKGSSGIYRQRRNTENGIDSGIDSPDTYKSKENIYRSFEYLNKDEETGSRISVFENVVPKHLNREERNVRARNMGNINLARSREEGLDRIAYGKGRNISRSSSDSLIIETSGPARNSPNVKKRPKSSYVPDLPADGNAENVYADITYAEITSAVPFKDNEQKREVESINEIKSFTIDEIGSMLKKIQLQQFRAEFGKHMINGKLLLKLIDQPKFREDMKLKKFEMRKLYKYVHGWRPKKTDLPSTAIKHANVREWSIANVLNQMEAINLKEFGKFCTKHYIDGALLTDLIDNNLIISLEQDYGLRFSITEYERLKGFISKDLKYSTRDRKHSKASNL